MPIIDRYICLLFGKIFLICFISFAGLYVVIDTFANLEELLELGKIHGSMSAVMLEYYGPRVLQFFDRTAPLIALVAAIFSLVLMQRANETTAILAGGISARRIARPILAATIVINLMAIANREVWIPKVRHRLTVNAQDLARSREHNITASIDYDTGIVIRGKQVRPTEQVIVAPEFVLPEALAEFGPTIVAESGKYCAANPQRERGYLLQEVQEDPAFPRGISQSLNSQPAIYRAADTSWLEPGEAFVVTEIDTQQLAFADELTRFAPLTEMIEKARRPSTSFSNRQRVDLHGRVVQPVFDLSIVLIGLPLVVARGQRRLLVSVGICLLTIGAMLLSVIFFQAMGSSRIINPPALAAWLPLIVFLPLAVVAYRSLEH